jgi:hypothetical protein
MRPRLLVRGFLIWLVLIAAESVHGVARALWLVPVVGDFPSRQIGVLTGTLINATIAVLCIRWIRPCRVSEAIGVGLEWIVLTVTFEVVFGRRVVHASWARLWSDYDLTHGGLLGVGVVTLGLVPLFAAKIRRVL